MDSKIYPGLNKILVEEQQAPDTGSILMTGVKLTSYGEIKAVGSIKDRGDIDENAFKVGDKVYFLTQAGFNMELPEGQFKLLNITEVLVGVRCND